VNIGALMGRVIIPCRILPQLMRGT